ncbi:hypothetical protein BCR33DRAFT_36971 [Rhizoclosmatium globosum]|uniref:PXA domain-containing protein n=1 Tax=Rhizoclosmatium globosum TaxID=329046 RepID=A0A1Y2CNI3_9FUNG|nr:hypothetical protein BCR33DRAFT_36971 [Rhizoclosmatium globosum]|eukprot:ORY48506.1 hypothetical protein BCR33DRAFT_36971 [Rhizoclosmatium globosum]
MQHLFQFKTQFFVQLNYSFFQTSETPFLELSLPQTRMPLKHLVTSKEALEFIHASIQSAISSTLYSIVKRPLYSATLYFIFLLCYSSPTFRATLYHILVLIGIWNIFLSDGGVVVKAKQLGKLVREPSRYLLPHSAFIAKPTVTESKSTSMKLQVVIPLAPSTEKPLMEVVSAFSKTTLTPIVNIITQGDDDAKVLEVIESAIISAITEIGRKSSNIDFTALVSLKLVPKITQHIKDCRLAAIKASKITSNNSKIQSAGSETIDEALLVQCYRDGELHSALKSWTAEGPEKSSHKLSEIEYLKGIVRQLLPTLFENDTKSSVFSTLMTELLADQVLKAGIDMLSDFDYWNQIFDTLGDHVMSQEHVLAKRISEAVEKQINEEDVEREDKQPVPQSLLDSGIAAMISNGNIEDILDEIKSCTILKDAMKMKECIQNEIMADKARMESLAKGNYGELIQVKDIKHRIKLYHKAVKRVKRRIRVLKRQKNGGSNQEKSNVPPLEEILKSGQLRSFFQEFDSLLPRTNSVRPHYYQLWTKLSNIEAQTGLMISEGNPAEHRHVLESQSSRLSTATVLQDSYFDLADFYDTEDISVSPVIMDSIKTFLETEVNSRFWSLAGTHIQESENLKDDLQTLHEKISNALNTIGTSNQPLVLLNDLEPLWKLRHSIIEELESVEYCSFLKSSQCEDMMSCIAEDLDDGNCETIENQADSNSGPLQIRRWSKLPSKKLFAALHWMKAKDKDLMADATEVNDDEYIRSYIIPLKETSDDDGSDDELPVRWKTFADRRIKSPELRAKMKKRKSFDIFGMQQQSRGLLPTTEEVDCSDESDEEKTIGLMKKLKKKALEELSSLSCWKSKKQQPDEPKSANNSMTRSSSMRSPKQTMSPRSEPLKTDESTQSLGRKRVSSASIETITKPKPFHRLQSQSLEEFPKPGTQSNKEKFTLEPFRFLKSRRQSPSRTGSTDALSASPPGSMHSSAKTLKESPTNSNSLVSVLRRKSHQSPTRTSTQTSDTLSDKNPFIQGSNRRSTLTQGSDLIKSAAKGILQRVANGAETIKSFRPNLGRKKINSDAEAESSGYESCNDNALDRTWSESYETVLEEMEVSEDGPFVDSATLEKKGVTQADILLPALSTPRIIELDEVMENTRSELEDVQEHLANSAQLDLSASRIRALNLMKAGLEVELKRLETEKAACKDRDIQNLISP